MTILVKVYATLREYTGGEGTFTLSYDGNVTVSKLLENLGVPREEVKMIMVNGRRSKPEKTLSDGDRVAVFPPIAGG